MKHLRKTIDRWQEPVTCTFYDVGLYWEDGQLFRKVNGYPARHQMTLIVSFAQAHALQRRALKHLFRFRRAIKAGANPLRAKWGDYAQTSVENACLCIEPGAAYQYLERHLGRRTVSRVIPSDASPEVHQMLQNDAGGKVVELSRTKSGLTIATYEKEIYMKKLWIIPKSFVEKSRCSNG